MFHQWSICNILTCLQCTSLFYNGFEHQVNVLLMHPFSFHNSICCWAATGNGFKKTIQGGCCAAWGDLILKILIYNLHSSSEMFYFSDIPVDVFWFLESSLNFLFISWNFFSSFSCRMHFLSIKRYERNFWDLWSYDDQYVVYSWLIWCHFLFCLSFHHYR